MSVMSTSNNFNSNNNTNHLNVQSGINNKNSNTISNCERDKFDEDDMQLMERMINSTDDLDELLENAPDSIFELFMGSNGKSYDFDASIINQYEVEDESCVNEINDSNLDQDSIQSRNEFIKSDNNDFMTTDNLNQSESLYKPTSSISSISNVFTISKTNAASTFMTTMTTTSSTSTKKFNSIDSTIERVTAASLQYLNNNNNSEKMSNKSDSNKININNISNKVTISNSTCTTNNLILGSNSGSSNNIISTSTPNAYLVDSNGLSTALSIIQSLNPGAKVTTQHFYLVNSGPQLILQPSSPLTATADSNSNHNSNASLSTNATIGLTPSSLSSSCSFPSSSSVTVSSSIPISNTTNRIIDYPVGGGLFLSKTQVPLMRSHSHPSQTPLSSTTVSSRIFDHNTTVINTMSPLPTVTPSLLKIPISDNRTVLSLASQNLCNSNTASAIPNTVQLQTISTPQPIGIVHSMTANPQLSPHLLSSQIRFIQPQHSANNTLSFIASSNPTNNNTNVNNPLLSPSSSNTLPTVASSQSPNTQPKVLFICPTPNNGSNFQDKNISTNCNTNNHNSNSAQKYFLLTKQPDKHNHPQQSTGIQLVSPQSLWSSHAPQFNTNPIQLTQSNNLVLMHSPNTNNSSNSFETLLNYSSNNIIPSSEIMSNNNPIMLSTTINTSNKALNNSSIIIQPQQISQQSTIKTDKPKICLFSSKQQIPAVTTVVSTSSLIMDSKPSVVEGPSVNINNNEKSTNLLSTDGTTLSEVEITKEVNNLAIPINVEINCNKEDSSNKDNLVTNSQSIIVCNDNNVNDADNTTSTNEDDATIN